MEVFPFKTNPKNLDPSYKMDLDIWDCFGRETHLVARFRKAGQDVWTHSRDDKTPFNSQINAIDICKLSF